MGPPPSIAEAEAHLRNDMQQLAVLKARRESANEIVTRKMWWSALWGVLPVPVLDFGACTAVQIMMINDLARHYALLGDGIVLDRETVRKWIFSLSGAAIPTYLKAVPVLGFTAGILTGPLFYGASTYAIGKVFIEHFETGGTLLTFDADKMRAYFLHYYEEGKAKLRARATVTATTP
ncbi:MAG TPA: DUF697 domain-containing protein [Thermoanaerobaculia bacterium]|jgi:uncharacterized protein (DUF697 family)